MSGKIKSLDEIKQIAANAKNTGKNIVFTNGCFDILHRGHVHLLREAKALGDILVVGVNSDRSVQRIKGPDRPILPETDRGANERQHGQNLGQRPARHTGGKPHAGKEGRLFLEGL